MRLKIQRCEAFMITIKTCLRLYEQAGEAELLGALAEGLERVVERRRLYIGNLAYATTEGELKEFFSASTSRLARRCCLVHWQKVLSAWWS